MQWGFADTLGLDDSKQREEEKLKGMKRMPSTVGLVMIQSKECTYLNSVWVYGGGVGDRKDVKPPFSFFALTLHCKEGGVVNSCLEHHIIF